VIELYMMLTPNGDLSLAAIFSTLEKAQQALLSEFPPGHKILPGYRIVRVQVRLLEVY